MKKTTKRIYNYIKKHNDKNLTTKMIADALRVSPRQVMGVVNSFVSHGWVRREADDKMNKTILLTELGKTMSVKDVQNEYEN